MFYRSLINIKKKSDSSNSEFLIWFTNPSTILESIGQISKLSGQNSQSTVLNFFLLKFSVYCFDVFFFVSTTDSYFLFHNHLVKVWIWLENSNLSGSTSVFTIFKFRNASYSFMIKTHRLIILVIVGICSEIHRPNLKLTIWNSYYALIEVH